MTPIVKSLPSYIKDSNHALEIFRNFNFSGENKIIFPVSVSVLVYYLATISYTSRNNKYIHKISRRGKEGHKKPQGLYEMDLVNLRI